MIINNNSEIYRKLGLTEGDDMPHETKRVKRVKRGTGGPMSMSDALNNQPRPAVTLPGQMQEGSQQGQDQKPGYKGGGATRDFFQNAVKRAGKLSRDLGMSPRKKQPMQKEQNSVTPKAQTQETLSEPVKGFNEN